MEMNEFDFDKFKESFKEEVIKIGIIVSNKETNNVIKKLKE